MKYTFEAEDQNSFSFLEVEIIRKSKRFVTSNFRKGTFSGVFTNNDCVPSDTSKVGSVYGIFYAVVQSLF